MKKRLSIEEIKSRIIGENFELISAEYINAHKKLDWKCLECGNIFQSSWLNVSFGWKCSFCKNIKTSIRIKKMRKDRGDGISDTEMSAILQSKGLEFVNKPPEYISNLGKLYNLRCLSCNKESKIRLQDVSNKSGYGCWDCSRPKGEKHYFWRGGHSDYPSEWNHSLKETIRNRDNRKCQYPDCDNIDIGKKRRLHVHHINGNKQECRNFNLISLCEFHHLHIEKTNPKEWQEYFYSITEDYEWRK